MSFIEFNLFEDSTLLTEFSGTKQLVEFTDHSEGTAGKYDFSLWLGSNNDEAILQAASNPGVDQIVITPTDILPEWEATTAYVSGDKVQPVSGNGFVYKCITSGTSDSSEPSWPVVGFGSTVVDDTCLWELNSAHHAKTEVKLALTSGGLNTATGGSSLNLGNTIDGSVATALRIYIRITNAVTNVANNTGNEEIGLNINDCIETVLA